MSPSLSVVQTDPSRRRNDAPALSSPAKPSEPSIRPSTNHLNPTGTSTSLRPSFVATRSMMPLLTMVLPTRAPPLQSGRLREQIGDRGREIMVRIHQAARAGHDAVPVGVGIVGEGDVEFVAHADQPRHRVGRRAVHPDLAVPIGRHEAEGRVDRVADDGCRDPVALDDRLPEMRRSRRPADRCRSSPRTRGSPPCRRRWRDRRHRARYSRGDARRAICARGRTGSAARPRARPPASALAARSIHVGDVGIGRSAIRRIVFEAAILGRIVRRGDDDAVGETALAALVIGQDRVRDDRRRRIAAVLRRSSSRRRWRQTPRARWPRRVRTAHGCRCR